MAINILRPTVRIYQSLCQVYIIKYPRIFTDLKNYVTKYKEFIGLFDVLAASGNLKNDKYLDIYYLPIINRNIPNLIFPLLSVEQTNKGSVDVVGNVIEAECQLQVAQSINSATVTVKNPSQYYWEEGDKKSQCIFEPEDIVVIKLPGKDGKFRFSFTGYIDSIKTKKNKETEEWLLTLECEGLTRKLRKTRTLIMPGLVTFDKLGDDAKRALAFSQHISKVTTFTIPFSYITSPKTDKTEEDQINKDIRVTQGNINRFTTHREEEFYRSGGEETFAYETYDNYVTEYSNIKKDLEEKLNKVKETKLGFNMLDILTEIIIRAYSIDNSYLTYLDIYTLIVQITGRNYKDINTYTLKQKLGELKRRKAELEQKINPNNFSIITDSGDALAAMMKKEANMDRVAFDALLVNKIGFINDVIVPYKNSILNVNNGITKGDLSIGRWNDFYSNVDTINAELAIINELIDALQVLPAGFLTNAQINKYGSDIESYVHNKLNDYRVEIKTSSLVSAGYAIYNLPSISRSKDDIPICIIVATDQSPFDITFNTNVNFFISDFEENHSLIQRIVTGLDYEFYENEMGVLFIKPLGVEYLTPAFDDRYKLTVSDIANIDTEHDISNLYTGIIVKGYTAVNISLDPEAYGNVSQYEDLRMINRYGYIGYAPQKNIYGVSTEEGCQLYGKTLLQRNNRRNEYKCTVKLDRGDSGLKIGNWVWIEETNEIYFIESITHSFTPIEYMMSLSLHTRRVPLFKTNSTTNLKATFLLALQDRYYDSVTFSSFQSLQENEIFNLLNFNGYIWEPLNLLNYKKINELIANKVNSTVISKLQLQDDNQGSRNT